MRITGGRVFDLEQGFVSRDVCTDGALIAPSSGDDTLLDAKGCYVILGVDGALGQVHHVGLLDKVVAGLVKADVAIAADAQQLQADIAHRADIGVVLLAEGLGILGQAVGHPGVTAKT